MTESLRDRIALIVTRMGSEPCCEDLIHVVTPSSWSLSVADAVIRELRLSVDRGVIIGCDGKCATNECGCPCWGQT